MKIYKINKNSKYDRETVKILLQNKFENYRIFLGLLASTSEFRNAIIRYKDNLVKKEKSIISMSDDYGNQKISNKQVKDKLENALNSLKNVVSKEEAVEIVLNMRLSTKLVQKIFKIIKHALPNLQEIEEAYENYKKNKEAIVLANLKLVMSLARNYSTDKISVSDLIQEGNIGLIRAVEKFNPNEGTEFSTYANWWISQAFKKAIKNQTRTIRLPEHVYQLLTKIRKESLKFKKEHNIAPTLEQLSVLTGKSVACIENVLDIKKDVTALQNFLTPDGSNQQGENTTENFIISDPEQHALNNIYLTVEYSKIKDKIKTLSITEQTIIILRFGLEGNKVNTLQEISNKLGLSKERIRQLEENALKYLQSVTAE